MGNQKKIILTMFFIAIFTFIVAASSLYVQREISSGNVCGCLIPIPLFIPFLAALGIFIGTLVFYLLSPRQGIDKKLILNFFEGEEKQVIELLLANKELSQSKISKLSGLGKVKTFRLIGRLVSKGVVVKEKRGKVIFVRLNDKIFTWAQQ